MDGAAPAPPTCRVQTGTPPVQTRILVQDNTGAAIVGARVTLACGPATASAQTGADGAATISLRPGTYQLDAAASGFSAANRQVEVAATPSPLTVTLSVAATGDVVNVSAADGIVPFMSNFGSKDNASLAEIPQTVNVINEREMQIRDVQSVNQALYYTPGVETDEYGVELRQDWMKVRGFTSDQYGVFRDGMRWDSLAGKIDPFELQSVEVVKGPASVLYGQAPPGGLVNLTTKRPVPERFATVEGQFGSYDRRQGQFDLGGSFDPNQRFRYRLLGLIRDTGTQVNYTPDNRRLLAPEFTWQPSDHTNFTLLTDWQHDTTKWSQFLPEQGILTPNPNGPIPVSVFAGEPGREGVVRDQASVGYLADHVFADGWEIHQNYRYQYSNFQGSTVYGIGFVPGSLTEVERTNYAYPQYTWIHTLDTRALRRFTTPNWEHTVLAGFDFSDLAQRTQGLIGSAEPINIYHPVYGTPLGPLSAYLNNFTDSPQYGVYLQDQVKYKQHLVLTLGGREDWAVNDVTDFLYRANQHQNNSKFTGRAGVTWLTNIGINPYYSYATSFQPTSGTNYYGQLYRPTYGAQNEVGVKIQPRTWNSYITASFFNIDQSNVLIPDPTNPNNSIQSGSVRSRGVELEAVSQLRSGFTLHTGYSYVSTNQNDTGEWFPQTPRNQFSFLGDYTVPHGTLAGLGGNFGVRFTGASFGDAANTLAIPNYTLLDAALRYTWRHTEFNVTGTNLTNKIYVATCTGAAYCGYGFARNVLGDVKYHF